MNISAFLMVGTGGFVSKNWVSMHDKIVNPNSGGGAWLTGHPLYSYATFSVQEELSKALRVTDQK